MQQNDNKPKDDSPAAFFGNNIVSAYTRADAIGDGNLIDVSEVAKEAGFAVPVALTRAAWADCVEWTAEDTKRKGVPQDEEGRLWDVLFMCRQTARHIDVKDSFYYLLLRVPREGKGRRARQTRLKAILHPGDQGEPVITIMLPDES